MDIHYLLSDLPTAADILVCQGHEMTRNKRLPLITLIHRKFLMRLQHLPKGQRRMIMEQYSKAVSEASLQWSQEFREEKTGAIEVLRDSEYIRANWPERK